MLRYERCSPVFPRRYSREVQVFKRKAWPAALIPMPRRVADTGKAQAPLASHHAPGNWFALAWKRLGLGRAAA